MKLKLCFLSMLLFCGFFFVSCSKEVHDTASLEGTWKSYKAEALFDGKVVLSGVESMVELYSIAFEDGYATFFNSEGKSRYPYLFSDGTITIMAYILASQMAVKELSKKELVVEIPIPSFAELRGGKVAEYQRKNIYKCYNDPETFFYLGDHAVVCLPIDEDNYDAGWIDHFRVFFKRQ